MKKTYLSFILFAVLFAACTDKFDDYNTDKKNPVIVEGNALFTSAQLSLVDQISTPDFNYNIFKIWAQYWTPTINLEEVNYDIQSRSVPDSTFKVYYLNVLEDLDEAARLIKEETTDNQSEEIALQNRLWIIDLMMVYAYHHLVDIFGDIPYAESLDPEKVVPRYDDAFTIYQDLISRINTALAGLDDSEGSFGSADIIYGGDVAAWIKFGNSLKVKLGIGIADHDAGLAASAIESAVSGVFESNYDNALLYYLSSPPNSNPAYDMLILDGRQNLFVSANTIIDLMNGLDDPRREAYFTQVDTSSEWGIEKLAYVGGIYGESNTYNQYSHVADPMLEATFPGILLTYDEILFYLAEAAERGFAVSQTPEEYYNAAITASFEFRGISDVESYLAKPDVAYAMAQGDWKEKIGTQAYIAMYLRGLEGYTEWRRLDYPIFNVPPFIAEYNEIPKRFTYPMAEQYYNLENYTSAAAAVGGDELTTKIFWDKN